MFASRESLALFPTPVFFFRLAETAQLDRGLCAHIDDERRSRPTVARGEHHGGWQSDNQFFDRDDATRALRDRVARAIVELDPSNAALDGLHLAAWANFLAAGDSLSPHTHTGAWSGGYYPDPGESSAAAGGLLVFRDPRAGAHAVESRTRRFDSACAFEWTPARGTLIIFPAWLLHWVTPYRGTRPRYSVAFNAW